LANLDDRRAEDPDFDRMLRQHEARLDTILTLAQGMVDLLTTMTITDPTHNREAKELLGRWNATVRQVQKAYNENPD